MGLFSKKGVHANINLWHMKCPNTATANFGCAKCAAKITCTLYASSLRACVVVLFLKNVRRRNTTICLSMPLDVGEIFRKGGSSVGN